MSMLKGWVFTWASVMTLVVAAVFGAHVVSAQEVTDEDSEVCTVMAQDVNDEGQQLTDQADAEVCEEQVVDVPEVEQTPIKGEPSPETVAGTNEERVAPAPVVLGTSTEVQGAAAAVLAETGFGASETVGIGIGIILLSTILAVQSRYTI